MRHQEQQWLFERAAPAPAEHSTRHALPGSIILPRVDLSRPPEVDGDEPPIDRLRLRGPRSLSDAELLSLLLRNDDPSLMELDAVRGLLREIGLVGVAQLDESFFYRSGWEEGPTASLLAAVELARRLARIRLPKGWLLKSPSTVADYLILRYQCGQEVLGVLFLDSRQRLFAEREIYRGTVSRAAVDPRDILKHALLYGASRFIVFHSHPSGDPTPSGDDLDFTRRLAEAADVIGIHMQDHLILGLGGRWVSLQARGAF